MTFEMIQGVPVWGEPLDNAVAQIVNCAGDADAVALMADHHLGYSVPIGGVVAYRDKLSPAGVGYDIACGNKAVRLDIAASEVKANIHAIMDDVWATISFGIGRKNKERVDDQLFDNDPAWDLPVARNLKKLAAEQLGTVGSGNHYIDIFEDEEGRIWVGVHFGSRGLGHRLATHFMKAADRERGDRQEPTPVEGKRRRRRRSALDIFPSLLAVESDLGQEYLACMQLAGRYAYAGRNWVCNRVAELLGAKVVEEIHNHHNFAWKEVHNGDTLWVTRKGATPAFPGRGDSSGVRWGTSRSFSKASRAKKAG